MFIILINVSMSNTIDINDIILSIIKRTIKMLFMSIYRIYNIL